MTPEQAQDQKEKTETRDRIIRLEMTCEKLAETQEKMFENLDKIVQQTITRDHDSVIANADLHKALFTMTTNMSALSTSIGDLRDSVKELKMSQEKTSKEMLQVLDLQDEVKKLEQQCSNINARVVQIETLTVQAKTSWKTVTIVATVTVAVVSALWTATSFVLEHMSTISKVAGG